MLISDKLNKLSTTQVNQLIQPSRANIGLTVQCLNRYITNNYYKCELVNNVYKWVEAEAVESAVDYSILPTPSAIYTDTIRYTGINQIPYHFYTVISDQSTYLWRESDGVERITTDDIPEGSVNKYGIDGKRIGDVVLRYSPAPLADHYLLYQTDATVPVNNNVLYQYNYPDFYNWCVINRERGLNEDPLYEIYTHSADEWDTFYSEHGYCPYFGFDTATHPIYEVSKNNATGYTPLQGNAGEEVDSGFIYANANLTTILDTKKYGWIYTGETTTAALNYVKVPSLNPYLDLEGNTMYYFIIVDSVEENNSTSVVSVAVGSVTPLEPDALPYIVNSGTARNLLLDFGIPKGYVPTVGVGTVTSGTVPTVTTTDTDTGVNLNFTFPEGPEGPAGEVIPVIAISSSAPLTPSLSDKYFNTSDNKVYNYNGSIWQEYADANKGTLYSYQARLYIFTGSELEVQGVIVDNSSIVLNNQGEIQASGVVNLNSSDTYNVWIGTEAEWNAGRESYTIPDTALCIITDD